MLKLGVIDLVIDGTNKPQENGGKTMYKNWKVICGIRDCHFRWAMALLDLTSDLGKRLIKSPKLYIADSGLACHLLGIETEAELRRSPFLGALFEGFLASEIVKAQVGAGGRREIYYFRDQQGLEVDFIVPGRHGRLTLVEAKAGRTVRPEMATSLRRLAAAVRGRPGARRHLDLVVVHQPPRAGAMSDALAPGVRALPWRDFVDTLARVPAP